MATPTSKKLIAIAAPVSITAGDGDGEKKGPAKFVSTFYTGGKLDLSGWDLPVVVDLSALAESKVLVANLDHDSTKRVGNFAVANDGKSLVASGTATAKTAARDEVIDSALAGYQWQSSLEVSPGKVTEIKAGKKITINGQEHVGPFYQVAGTLKGFGFVSHGADDNTTATIAAQAAPSKGKAMKAEVKAWAEGMGIDTEAATPEAIATIEANYEGRNGKKTVQPDGSTPSERRKIEAKRRSEITDIADQWMAKREGDLEWINSIEAMRDEFIDEKKSVQEFRNELYESMVPLAHTVPAPRNRDNGLNDRVLQAALCETGRLQNLDKQFKDEELQAAHDRFPNGISLNELMITAAQANGYRGPVTTQISKEIHNYAYGLVGGGRQITASGGGFSPINVANIVAATANKFMHEGWMSVDQTILRISYIRSVRNFQQITTVSLTGHLQFEKVGADGELKQGALADLTYTNQADTYGLMLAITRKDYINDDQGCLTSTPRRLGRGGMLKLNDIGWTELLGLVAANFFASGNSNINTGVADMTIGGLKATETIFLNQTDPDGKPLAIMPKIILVPTALKAEATALMDSQKLITGSDVRIGESNPFAGRFRVESSPYISNSSYTGNTAVGWWMLADPNECPVLEIVALNGRVEPTVETADAAFNVLGTQLRGYSDIGVNEQEKRGGVYADGGAS